MQSTIWKWPLSAVNGTISVPKVVQYLDVHMQHGVPCLWGLVDPTSPMQEVGITIVGTGHPIYNYDMVYLGTFLVENDAKSVA